MNAFERHGVGHLSASSLNLWAAQPALWVMERLLGRRTPPGVIAARGKAVEHGVHLGLSNPRLSVEECIEGAEREFVRQTALSTDPRREEERKKLAGWVRGALAELPPDARRLAVARGYLPDGVPLVKRIAALGGDRVCAVDDAVFVNGRAVAGRLARDGLGRPLPRWTGCRVLADDELFLLMEGVSGSFDGRYFGPVRRAAIIGRLAPLWTE